LNRSHSINRSCSMNYTHLPQSISPLINLENELS
jgi:hypothetical protein